MPRENDYYTRVVLNDNSPVDDSVSGREIQLIFGTTSKMAESTLVEFASQFTKPTRTNQGWSTEHVVVEPIEFKDLPPLGTPAHTDGDLKVWIVE